MTTTEKKYHPNGQLETESQFVDGVEHGTFIRYFDNGQIEIEAHHVHGQLSGTWKEFYQNGQISEEGEYKDKEYNVKNFWTETGDQLLVNGTGKTIRKFGASQGDIYEQYFDKGQFTGEKKIAGVSYGKFIPDK